ncbi:MAG TPA: hypothetical protein VGK96_23365, partial [Candidatus Sulfotelmatobacter sp.]
MKSFSGWMFNQPQAITVTTVTNTGVPGGQLYIQNIVNPPFWAVVTPPSVASGRPNAGAMADFNLDGYDDFAFSYDDGSILVATAGDVNNPNAGNNPPFNLGPIAKLDVLSDMVAGDFNGDGQPEIAGLSKLSNGGLQLVVYTVEPKTLAITPANALVLTTPGTNNANPITRLSIARGKFNTRDHDQLAVAFATDSGPSTVEIVDFAPNSLTPIEVKNSQLVASNAGISGGFIEVKTGRFAFPNPYDQIVWLSASPVDGGRFFEIISVDPTNLALTANPSVHYDEFGCSYGLDVGNFDHQQPDPLNPGKTEHDPNAQIAFMGGGCDEDNNDKFINIYSVDPDSFNLNYLNGNVLPINDPYNLQNPPALSLVATDLQGRSAVLGAPTKVTIDNTRTTVITAAPPMHIDYITPVGASKPEVLNLSYIPDGFNNSYQLTQESKQGGSTTHKLSWSAGAAETVSGGFQIGNPDAGEGAKFTSTFHAAQDFTGSTEANGSNFSTTDFNVSVATRDADSVFYDNSRLNIWVYPVLGQKVPSATPSDCPAAGCPLTIQFSGPDQIDTGNISADIASWYQPPWEFGNVFSYPATKDQLALIYPDLAATQLSSDLTFYTDTNSKKVQANWSSGSTQGSTTSTANNFSFDLSGTYVESEGIPEVGFETGSVSLNVSGSFGFKNLQTQTASMKASSGIGIQAVGLFRDPPNYAYAVTPVILGNSPPAGIGDSSQPPAADIETIGPLKTAFVADPLANSAGAWWTGPSSPYRAAPDVALNHSSRWILTEPALSNPIPDNCGNTGTGASQMDCADIAPYMP